MLAGRMTSPRVLASAPASEPSVPPGSPGAKGEEEKLLLVQEEKRFRCTTTIHCVDFNAAADTLAVGTNIDTEMVPPRREPPPSLGGAARRVRRQPAAVMAAAEGGCGWRLLMAAADGGC